MKRNFGNLEFFAIFANQRALQAGRFKTNKIKNS